MAIGLTQQQEQSLPQATISVEAILYIGLLLVSGLLRLLQLDAVPISPSEAQDALATFMRISPDAPQNNLDMLMYPLNSLGALFATLSMTILGGNEFGARFPTAVAGCLLVASPWLYRQYIGRSTALLIAVGLAISPIAIAASRTMGGTVWALLLVMIMGRLALDTVTAERQQPAIGAMICLVGIILLTTPYGLWIALMLLTGLVQIVTRAPQDNRAGYRQKIRHGFEQLFKIEAIGAGLITIVIVATGFFTVTAGLSSVTGTLEAFLNGFTERVEGATFAHAFLVSLRYDLAFLLFSILALWTARNDETPLESFMIGWLVVGAVIAIFYPAANSDFALLLTLPAVTLTATFTLRMIQTAGYGYWSVPNWLLPIHAITVACLLVSMGLNVRSIAVTIASESNPNTFPERIDASSSLGDNVRISGIEANVTRKATIVNLPLENFSDCQNLPHDGAVETTSGLYCIRDVIETYTVYLNPIDPAIGNMTIEVLNPDGELIYQQGIGEHLTFTLDIDETAVGDYRFEVVVPEGSPPREQTYQYLMVMEPGNLVNPDSFSEQANKLLVDPSVQAYAIGLLSFRNPNPAALIVLIMILLIIPITFFLSGAFFGARAAWRGLGFGALLYLSIYGMGLGWQATTLYGGDIRELWYTQAAPEDYYTISEVLSEYSRRDNGTPTEMNITMQHDGDGALGWAVRHFKNIQFVERLDPSTTTPAILVPDGEIQVAADYVGQAVDLGYDWQPSDLTWVDMGSWLFMRQTRQTLEPSDTWRIWIRSDVYDVINVPNSE